MPIFAYRCKDNEGKTVAGHFEGADEAFVTEKLRESGYTATELVREDEDWRPDPTITMVNSIIMYGIKDGASDIQVEPRQNGVQVLYRIGGTLTELADLPEIAEEMLTPILTRIKTMAALDLTRSDVPQDGRICVQMHEKYYDLVVSTGPTKCGERVSMSVGEHDIGAWGQGNGASCNVKRT